MEQKIFHMSDKIRKQIIFHGRVQGVGFRWHATNYANSAGLTGWVQNLEDGTVEIEVQGSDEKIDSLITYLENRDYVLIEKMDCNSLSLENSEWEFREIVW